MKRRMIALTLILAICMFSGAALAKAHHARGGAMKGNSVVAVANGDTTLAMFVKHVGKAGLTKTLEGKGPFTVFAPDNAAFNARSQADITAEHSDNSVLVSTMKYHVVAGKELKASDLMGMNGQSLTMDNGMTLPITVQNGTVMIGDAHVTRTDIMAGNGVIHVIDKVIIPGKTMPASAPMPSGSMTPSGKQ